MQKNIIISQFSVSLRMLLSEKNKEIIFHEVKKAYPGISFDDIYIKYYGKNLFTFTFFIYIKDKHVGSIVVQSGKIVKITIV